MYVVVLVIGTALRFINEQSPAHCNAGFVHHMRSYSCRREVLYYVFNWEYDGVKCAQDYLLAILCAFTSH
jgi:hypothetical protein